MSDFRVNCEPNDPSDEVGHLRRAIGQWQKRRLAALSASVAFITAVLSLKIMEAPTEPQYWPLVSAVLIVFLTCSCLFTWYSAIANTKISAYLATFWNKESPWEFRLTKFKQMGVDRPHMNHLLGLSYMALAISAVILPYFRFNATQADSLSVKVLVAACSAFVGALFLLLLYSYPRKHYIELWGLVRDQEAIEMNDQSSNTLKQENS